MSLRVCLVEDSAVAGLDPLALTRPAYELILGATSLEAKARASLGLLDKPVERGAVVRSHLVPMLRERDPGLALNDRDWLAGGPLLAVNCRWIPPTRVEWSPDDSPWVGWCDGQPACAWVGPAEAGDVDVHSCDQWLERLGKRLPGRDVGGEWVAHPWDLVAKNHDHLVRDYERIAATAERAPLPPHVAVVGPADRVIIHPSARLDPFTVLDTTNGPIMVGPGVLVQPFTRIEGPCSIGAGTQLFRANLRGGVSLGANCRIGGEVEESIVLGHSNKYHEGFLGHAYVGEWVNLGAITSNSDLRNDYGEVQVPLRGDPVATGMLKVGCFIGDHTRTGLGSMINTGTSIGVMCNILPAGFLLPKHVPSFTAVLYGGVAPGFTLDQLFATARTVKGRRGQSFTALEEQFYHDLYERTRLERERAFQRSADRGPWARQASAAGG